MWKLAIILAAVAVSYGQAKLVNTYVLYTKATQNMPQTIDATLPTAFMSGLNTIILVHGHGGSVKSQLNPLVKDAILKYQDPSLNVIVVDWSKEASYSYSVAVESVPLVAKDLGDFIIKFFPAATDVAKLHLVGFGLGAHVVGIAGRQVAAAASGPVARITGLDPSGSQWGANSARLRRTDAAYVEVIHTDGSGLFSNGIGTALGDIDIYANGGSNQPGCLTNTCSHERAYELFAASMFNTNLNAAPCSSSTQLNLNLCRGNPLPIGGVRLSKTGSSRIYRINTKRNYPF
ncbi:lipase member I-like [Helicoverpa zea]|uniref:lipase member I-like n=1 Tax=Helicoverpa zea TaxID=7113 RepID=UPI001F5AEED2|nr:lipase member I-like [Helicoverpa zea]